MQITATYSPDDNKIRLYASARLDAETYAGVKAAGFNWAPKQGLFYATWRPCAEDKAIELAGEITDEDKTLTERAEERAERFETYEGKRANDAQRASDAASAISGNIPFGQPILIGHHSERRARKDAERITSNMQKAVKMWETSEYWASRAAGALHHAKYKELPGVRARRIKTIEADMRRQQRNKAEAEKALAMWTNPTLTLERARDLSGFQHYGLTVYKNPENNCTYSAWDCLRPDGERYAAAKAMTLEEVQEIARRVYPRSIAYANRWIAHYENRLVYEKAMLEEQGASALIAKKPRPKQLPLVNYRLEGGKVSFPSPWRRSEIDTIEQIDMTSAEYMAIYSERRGTQEIERSHRIRIAYVSGKRVAVFLTDSKTHTKPEPVAPIVKEPKTLPVREYVAPQPTAAQTAKEQLQATLKAGVSVAVADQLFVTPEPLAQRVIEAAQIEEGHRVLEPSAGTGNLLKALPCIRPNGQVVAVEINQALATSLEPWADEIVSRDFLQCNGDLGKFDRIVMNPPFANQADIEHVTHALKFLNAGGKLVAIMSAGVEFRQDRKATEFRALVERMGGTIEALPEGSFKQSGTNVNTVLVEVCA